MEKGGVTISRRARGVRGRHGSIVNGVIFLAIFTAFFILSILSAAFAVSLGYPVQDASFLADAGFGLSMTASVLIYLFVYKKMSAREAIDELGLGRKGLSWHTVLLGIMIFMVVLLSELGTTALSEAMHVQINTNTAVVLAGAPLWFYLFAAVIEPINEEVLFRGLMVPRIGIVLSALIFGIMHIGYNSTFAVEVIAAIIFGLVSGYVYKRTGSLYPAIIAHIIVDTLAVIAILA